MSTEETLVALVDIAPGIDIKLPSHHNRWMRVLAVGDLQGSEPPSLPATLTPCYGKERGDAWETLLYDLHYVARASQDRPLRGVDSEARHQAVENGERWYNALPAVQAEQVMRVATDAYSMAFVGSQGRVIDHERALRSALAAASTALSAHSPTYTPEARALFAAQQLDDGPLRAILAGMSGNQIRELIRSASTLDSIARRALLDGEHKE